MGIHNIVRTRTTCPRDGATTGPVEIEFTFGRLAFHDTTSGWTPADRGTFREAGHELGHIQ